MTGLVGFRCEECGGTEFLEGPHGGLAVNFACAKCWARYNDTIFNIDRDGFVDEAARHAFHGEYIPRTRDL